LKRQLAEAQRAANGNGEATSQTQSNIVHENSMLRCGAGLSTRGSVRLTRCMLNILLCCCAGPS
jgi:hypothetical protein